MLPWPVQRCVLGIRAMVAGAVAKAPAAGATTRTGAGRTWGLGRSDLWRAGVLAAEDDGNRLVCHACGQAFRSLGTMWALVRSMGAHARSYRSATASRVLWSNRSRNGAGITPILPAPIGPVEDYAGPDYSFGPINGGLLPNHLPVKVRPALP
jgi:hypothetical protein